MIDVAAVVLLMWEEVLPKAAQKRLARALGLPADKVGLELAGKMVAWIAGLHDLGKASPPFALRETAQNLKRIYDRTGFSEQYLRRRKAPPPQEAPHGYVTASELPDILTGEFGFPGSLAKRIAALIGGHHGIFPRSEQLLKSATRKLQRRRSLAGSTAGADSRTGWAAWSSTSCHVAAVCIIRQCYNNDSGRAGFGRRLDRLELDVL